MAKMTEDQWAELKADWEASPKQGIDWMSRVNGGPWDLTPESIRRRRNRDALAGKPWVKPLNMAKVVHKARVAADANTRLGQILDTQPEADGGGEEVGEDAPSDDAGELKPKREPTLPAEEAAIDLRRRLIEMHRQEWRVSRRIAYRAMQAADEATGFDLAKFAKIITEILHNIQLGERRAYGLDADLMDLSKMTDAQLQAISEGKTPR